jgi:hypothetical protein
MYSKIKSALAFFAVLSMGLCFTSSATAGPDTVVNFGAVDIFDGPNDLDLDGNIIYAIDNGTANDVLLAGVQFTGEQNVIAGYTTNSGQFGDWSNYNMTDGSAADNAALTTIMRSINCCHGPAFTYDFDVTPGNVYQVQMLWAEGGQRPRIWDIEVEGAIALDEVEVHGLIVGGVEPAPAAPADQGVRFMFEYEALDDTLNIVVGQLVDDGGQLTAGRDNNSVINAIIVEDLGPIIPEPSTLILAVLGLLGLSSCGWRRRRRSC